MEGERALDLDRRAEIRRRYVDGRFTTARAPDPAPRGGGMNPSCLK